MANPPKARGTAAESAVRDLALSMGIPAIRVALSGAHDRGDVHLWPAATGARVVIEVKSRRKAWTWTEIDAWFREATAEAERVEGADMAVLVVKRPGSGPKFAGDWYAWVTVGDLIWWTANRQMETVEGGDQRVMMPLGDLLALLGWVAP